MRRSIIAMLAVVVALCGACDDGNLIKDPALRACVEAHFDWLNSIMEKPQKFDVNNKDDLAEISSTFACESRGVKSLEGIEYLVNVTNFSLKGNEIEEVSPLAEHKKLTSLNLTGNKIRDVESIGFIENLNVLFLVSNYVSDITPLKNNKNLYQLFLVDNCITDLTQCDKLMESNTQLTPINGCTAADQHPEKCQ